MKAPKLLWGIGAALALTAAACGPAAEPTATTGAQPQATATRAPQATSAQATATTARLPTATTAAAAATATTASETKLRPVPVVGMPQKNPLAKHGGTYRQLAYQDHADFAIWEAADGRIFQVSVPVTDSLLDRNEFEPNKNDQVLSNVAYDYWTDKTGTTWTFKLTEGIKFHDGKPFTCADAEFSLETLRDGRDATGDELRRSPRGAFLRRVTDISCADNSTLVMKTDGPLPSLPATLAISSFSLMPKHVFEGHLDLLIKQSSPGIGPWVFERWQPTEVVAFKRNANYWNQPYPYMDAYHVLNLGSETAANAAFRVGRAEGGGTLTKAQREEGMAQGRLWQPVLGTSDSFTGYQANWTKAPWNDKRFSLAMRCAIDTMKAVNTANNGEAYEGPIVPLPTVPGAPDWGITEAEWKAIHPCHGPSGDAANMEKRRQIARDLLKEMGFGPTNLARPTGYWSGNDPTFVSVQADLAKVGIEMDARAVTLNERYEIQTNATTDILQQGFVTSRRDPDHWFYEQYYGTSDRNYGRYRNAEVDALIDQQSRTLDKAKRYELLNKIQKLLLQDNAKIVARHGMNTRVFPIWVKDAYWGEPANSQNTSIKYTRIWIDQELLKKFGAQ